jgi:hypothetical protein
MIVTRASSCFSRCPCYSAPPPPVTPKFANPCILIGSDLLLATGSMSLWVISDVLSARRHVHFSQQTTFRAMFGLVLARKTLLLGSHRPNAASGARWRCDDFGGQGRRSIPNVSGVTQRGRSRSAGSTALSPRTRTPSSIEPTGPRNRPASARRRPPSS